MARTVQIAIRLTPELAELVDRFAIDASAQMRESFPGLYLGRIDAIRILLTEGLEKRGYDTFSAIKAEERVVAGTNGSISRLRDSASGEATYETPSSGGSVEDDLRRGDLSQAEIARRHGCSRQHVSQVSKRIAARKETPAQTGKVASGK